MKRHLCASRPVAVLLGFIRRIARQALKGALVCFLWSLTSSPDFHRCLCAGSGTKS